METCIVVYTFKVMGEHVDKWRQFESREEAESFYAELLQLDSLYTATVMGQVLQSTDYPTTEN